jgi:hypothetical protein
MTAEKESSVRSGAVAGRSDGESVPSDDLTGAISDGIDELTQRDDAR